MDIHSLKSALEAVLFASGDPVPTARLSLVFGVPEEEIIETADSLAEEYESGGRGMRLLHLGKSLQLCSAPEYAKLISRVIEHRAAPRLSASAVEALAIIAYFQPVTRAYVEQVRGVDSSYTVASLAEKGLIEPAGRLEAPGRPTLYRTTEAFLRVMGISSLDELPTLPDMSESDGLEKLQDAVEKLRSRGEQLTLEMDAPDDTPEDVPEDAPEQE